MRVAAVKDLHEHGGLIAFVGSAGGRLALWLVATALLLWHEVTLLMPLALALVTFVPDRRRLLLSLTAVAVLAERILEEPGISGLYVGAGVLAGIVCLYVFWKIVQSMDRWPQFIRQHPVLALHACIWVALCLSVHPLFAVLSLVPYFAWRLSYLLMQASRGKLEGTRFSDHLFYVLPVYGGTATPYGKGLEYLSRHEARDPESFARSQLAGLKLLWLSLVWFLALDLLNVMFFGQSVTWLAAWPDAWTLDLERMRNVVQSGDFPPAYQGWGLIYLELIRATLGLAAKGHIVIGCLRLLGFNVFRNTYKPLLSQSILEFWNRFYYYFKEVMVDFFFYPTYLRLRRLGPSARMFTAIFTAAFVGNMYHHVLTRPETVTSWDPALFWSVWGPRFVYCFLLALGVGISMVRQQKLRAQASNPTALVRFRRMAGVWTFYGIILIWNNSSGTVTIGDCTRFFLSLFSL